jgi:hypothetical protein
LVPDPDTKGDSKSDIEDRPAGGLFKFNFVGLGAHGKEIDYDEQKNCSDSE